MIVGEKYASRLEELALACYKAGAAYAEERGIIIVSGISACLHLTPYFLAPGNSGKAENILTVEPSRISPAKKPLTVSFVGGYQVRVRLGCRNRRDLPR